MELEILGEDEAFFAPTSSDAIDHLLAQYRQEEAGIMRVQEIFAASEVKSALYFYLDGHKNKDIHYNANSLIDTIFDVDSAKNSLTAVYWSKALALTDVADFMPQKRRNEWNEVLSAWRGHNYKRGENPDKDMPEFNEESVRSTLQSLMVARSKFLAEKVDGCFTKLSRLHVTNQPEGFGKRIIMWYSSYSDLSIWGPRASYQECGYLNDLRSIISRFMGNEEIPHGQTSDLIASLIKTGRFNQWVSLDGNALRLKIFKKGTAHLELHPLMAQRLNLILASLHPHAIPSEFRDRPDPKVVKDFGLMHKPLAVNVIGVINKILETKTKGANEVRSFPLHESRSFGESHFAVDEALSVLTRLGGVIEGGSIAFDYDICSLVLNEINFTRCVPETKSHQFYPTPSDLSKTAMDMLQVTPNNSILEPSAGVGGLLQYLPERMAANVTCVEVAKLHCSVLERKGYGHVVCDDFLSFAKKTNYRWDRIIMNPPFSDGRAMLHLNAAVGLLKDGGKLVAILPAGAKNKFSAEGCDVVYSLPIDNAFADASVSVVICSVVKKAMAMAA